MSIIIESNGKEIWSPSLKVGKLFFDQVKSLEINIDYKSGINIYVADTYEIDAKIFDEFINRLLNVLDSTNNGPYFTLLSGTIEILIALNHKITGVWPMVSEKLTPLLRSAKIVMNPM